MILVIARHEYRNSDTTHSFYRNATPNNRARHALRRTVLLNASTKPLTFSPASTIIPNSYSGTSLGSQVQGMSHGDAGLPEKRAQNSVPTHPLPP